MKKGLILAAVPAVGVYAIGDVLSAILYDGYSYADQAISELSPFGSPVRPLVVTAILAQSVLLLTFSIGLLRAARRRTALWWVGAIGVAGFGVVGIPNHTFWAMTSRDMATGFNDTMHITLSLVFTVFVVTQMVLSAVAYRGWLPSTHWPRWPWWRSPGWPAGCRCAGSRRTTTPWAGGFERINAYAYFAWLVVLAVMVVRHELAPPPVHNEPPAYRPEAAIGA